MGGHGTSHLHLTLHSNSRTCLSLSSDETSFIILPFRTNGIVFSPLFEDRYIGYIV